jgi:hypothetical protein
VPGAMIHRCRKMCHSPRSPCKCYFHGHNTNAAMTTRIATTAPNP